MDNYTTSSLAYTTNALVSGLQFGIRYFFTVVPYSPAGAGVVAAEIDQIFAAAPYPPSAPQLRGVTGSDVVVYWNASLLEGSNTDRYSVEITEDGGLNWVIVAEDLVLKSYTISGQALGSSFQVRVSAYNGALSTYSDPSDTIVVASMPPSPTSRVCCVLIYSLLNPLHLTHHLTTAIPGAILNWSVQSVSMSITTVSVFVEWSVINMTDVGSPGEYL